MPNTPTVQARVKVVTWDADGGRVEDNSNANFTIGAAGIEQPGNTPLLPFAFYQPWPNPLVSGTAISYALPRPVHVELTIFNAAGALVRQLLDAAQPVGNRTVYWDGLDDRGRRAAPGVYYCRLKAGDFASAQKLVVRR